MAENLIESVQEKLKEETWTRATITNFTSTNLNELAGFVDKAKSEGVTDEVIAACYEHLGHTKDSVSALYLAGMLSLYKGNLDDTCLETLTDILLKNHKEQIVISLCDSILETEANNKFALRTLAEIKKTENNEEYWDLYNKIVKVDFEECELVKLLAEHYEESGDKETAIEFYKKALLRYVNAKNYTAIKEIWSKLVSEIPGEIDFFQLVRRKIAKTMGEIKTTILMSELYDWYKIQGKWDIAIDILKQNLTIDPKDTTARKEIVDCYRGKYAGHSHLEDYIRMSNLTASYRDVFEAINDFEKHIAFDTGSFVFHKNWGVGIISSLKNDVLKINFGKKNGEREMSLKMAVSALKPLSKKHIWVLKATSKPADLKAKVKENIKWALKTIIKSYDNSCDFKRIKAELVPSILSTSEWTSWNTKAKKILETNPIFGVDPNDINSYVVRDHELTQEEKLSNEFKAQKAFFARVDILMRYFKNELTDNTSDLFTEMYSYFTSSLKSISHVDEKIVASYLVVRTISKEDSMFAASSSETFEQIYKRIEDPRKMYNLLKDTKDTCLKAEFIECVRMLPNWQEEFIRLFPIVLDQKMLEVLIAAGNTDDVQKLVRTAFENFRDFRETVLFFFKECQKETWFTSAGVSYEKQLITLINIIELCFREINSHVNTTENKKIQKNAATLLFEKETIYNYMFANDENVVKKMYTLIDDIADLDPSYKAQMRSKILEKYPDFKFQISEEKAATTTSKGMIVTKAKLEEKKALLKDIQEVQMPENTKEIAIAKEKGDLKENAEYHAAREKQNLLGKEVSRLQSELNRAVVFDPTTLTTAMISFATCVTLTDNTTGADDVYTILGPWESDPDQGIISYMSPFGSKLMDKKVGDKLSFTINEHKYDYTVKAIKAAQL
ncbi:MAG: transcription elongation factor GreA [Treponema sp.]|nr:transcription elongation factor GreA [Treponema sp.]